MAKKILIVDDDENNIFVLNRMLKKQGYITVPAKSGMEALDVINKQKIDLVILDWEMPGMNGLSVCKKIKGNPKTCLIPIIMLSARSSSGDIKEGLDFGADDYATKPVAKTELLARVRASLRTGELQKKLDGQLKGVAKIQRQLLPVQLPESDDFKVAAFYTPSDDSGGDYYDVFSIGDRYTTFIIADVSSHGAPAMVTMALTRSFLKLLVSEETSPEKALMLLNNTLFDHLPTSQYVTMFYSVYDHQEKLLTFSAAGHPPPFHFKSGENSLSQLKVKPGFPLKLIKRDTTYHESQVKIEKGDKLFFYTDGYLEAGNDNGDILGFEGMENIFLQAANKENTLQYMIDQWKLYIGMTKQNDDITLLLAEF